MIATIIKSVVLAAIFLFCMWAGSLWLYDRAKMDDALEWRWAEINQEPLYRWPFDSSDEIIHGHGVKHFRWQDGVVSGDVQDPYFYLNLEGRYIDAGRFTVMRLRLRSKDENALRLFHREMREDELHASELLAVAPGWQTLTLSLPGLKWHVKNLEDPDDTSTESSWGGPAGVVSALRVDPVGNGDFSVDWIELYDSDDGPLLVDEVETFRTLHDDLFERMRADPGRTWFVAHDARLRTPETAHWVRQKIAEEFPSAIVFPRVPTVEELAYPPLHAGGGSAFIPASIFFAALLFLVVREQLPQPWQSLVAVFAMFTMVEAYIYWMPSLPSMWRILMAIPVLGAMWELLPKVKPTYVLGDPRAWLWLSPILAGSLLVIIFAPPESPQIYTELKSLPSYFLWALFQQIVIAVLILSRLKPFLGKQAIIVSAAFFGLFHFPNFALMVATFLLGIVSLHVYERFQNLLALAAAHAFLAVGFHAAALHFFWLSRTVGPEYSAGL